MNVLNPIVQHNVSWILDRYEPVLTEQSVDYLSGLGYNVLLTFKDHSFSLITRAIERMNFRHYSFTLAIYPMPNAWELQQINEFLIYELHHERSIAIWFDHKVAKEHVVQSISTFFEGSSSNVRAFVAEKMATQTYRATTIPGKLANCFTCKDKGCITDFVCHSSNVSNAKQILRSGKIVSASAAKQIQGSQLALSPENAATGDPPDYFDYVMFAFANCSLGDLYTMEKIFGTPTPEKYYKNSFFHGVRFYFSYKDLVQMESFTLDGYHGCKLKNNLPLEPYVTAIVSPEYLRGTITAAVPWALRHKMIYLDHTRYDFMEWAHYAYCAVDELVKSNYTE